MGPGEIAEERLAREPPKLGRRRLELACRIEGRQLAVTLVDLFDVERLLLPGEMGIELFVQLRDEAVGFLAERIELTARGGLDAHRLLG